MIYIIGIAIIFFLSFILVTKKEKSNADKILSMWLITIGIHLILFYLVSTQRYIEFPYLLGLEIPMPLLHGPFLFLYTASYTSPNSSKRKKLLHFIPFILGLVSLFPFLLSKPEEKISVYLQEGNPYSLLMSIFFLSIMLSGASYILLSLHKIYQHRKRIVKEYSYIEKINLKWLFYLILGLSAIWLISLFAGDQYIFSSVVLYSIFIGYYGIKQVGIFTNQYITESHAFPKSYAKQVSEAEIKPQTSKYIKSALSSSQLESIHNGLVQLMQQKKIYQTPELSLTDVAKELNVHPNSLSQVINRVEQKTFFDYINYLRVEEFKKMVANPQSQQFTLLSLAYECGFNSKTSFNRNFKKVTGIPPSKYLKEATISLQ